MKHKINRTNFMSIVDVSYTLYNNDISKEWDLLSSNWDLFNIYSPLSFDNIKPVDITRPDVLSYRIYGNSSYWWVLCKFNQIDDIWNDMYIGMDIIVPSLSDIELFYDKVRKRKRNNE